MARSGKNGAVRPPGAATSFRDRDIYERYATGLYRRRYRLPAPRLPGDVASGVLGIRPRDMAALLRAALLRLGTSPE